MDTGLRISAEERVRRLAEANTLGLASELISAESCFRFGGALALYDLNHKEIIRQIVGLVMDESITELLDQVREKCFKVMSGLSTDISVPDAGVSLTNGGTIGFIGFSAPWDHAYAVALGVVANQIDGDQYAKYCNKNLRVELAVRFLESRRS